MLKRLVFALLEGALPGVLAAFALSSVGAAGSALAVYAAAAAVGVLTGLLAGRPIWAKGAKVEGSLKAVVGLFISVTMLFGIRKWLPGVSVPWMVLPGIGVAYAIVLEIDDAIGADPPPAPRRIREEPGSLRVETAQEEDEEGAAGDDTRARRRG
jgi:hypothetical protein